MAEQRTTGADVAVKVGLEIGISVEKAKVSANFDAQRERRRQKHWGRYKSR